MSNIHTGNLSARVSIRQRVDVSAGYSLVQDVGAPGLVFPQTFPLRYLSPQGRVSLRIHEKNSWNAGYQYDGYHEDFSGLQNYRAHTGYTSMLWAF